MPAKKKKAGHTDYRTGGMFYPKYNEGGVNVAGYEEAAKYATQVREFEEQKTKDQKKLEP